ncbi:MAG: metallophosphoesterase [Lentisphaerae bacterium]|nr:metallophosphoesterase [Lentisphaerota bacterium]
MKKPLLRSSANVLLIAMLTACAWGWGRPATADVTAGVLDDLGEKKNFADGEQTDLREVGALFTKLAFVPDGSNSFYFVQLSDIHIYAEDEADPKARNIFNTDLAQDFVNVLNEINAMAPAPAFVIITGDLVHDAEVKQFERFKRLLGTLRPEVPLYLVLGNHDANRANYAQVFPDRPPYYAFSRGLWHFVVLDSRSDGSLERRQADWLREDAAQHQADPLMLFTHHPMIGQAGWEDVRPMREVIVRAIQSAPGEVWMFSGHLHFNLLARCCERNGPPVNLVTTASSTGSFGYEVPGYRLVCIDRRDVRATVYKRVGPEHGFRVDPPPAAWPVYRPPPMAPLRREVLAFEVPDDMPYVHTSTGVGCKDNYRFVDASGVLVYAVPVAKVETNLSVRLSIGSDYRVQASFDGAAYEEIFRSNGRALRQILEWTIPPAHGGDTLFLRIQDGTPEDGAGAFIYGLSIVGQAPP